MPDRLATIAANRRYSTDKLRQMRADLAANLQGADYCIVVTGSFGRHEAGPASDLDYFLIGPAADRLRAPHEQVRRLLTRHVDKPPADDGPFSAYVPSEELVHRIGLNADTNVITTRRLLFLLECEWLYNPAAKRRYFEGLIANYVNHTVTSGSLARFLINDVIRYYRTISVDFEIKTRGGQAKAWAPRRLKLVFSRKLLYFGGIVAAAETCGLDYLHKRQKLVDLLARPPIDRIDTVFGPRCHDALALYDLFLARMGDDRLRADLDAMGPEARNDPRLRELLDTGKRFSAELIALLTHRYPAHHPVHEALLM